MSPAGLTLKSFRVVAYDKQDVFHCCVLSQFAGGGFCVLSKGFGGLLNRFIEVTDGACM